ncbi:hypothetical protein LBMAG46_38420 [Planctomycetia bacterium]|nr:hypothetical protein LBMAG46_38420 [Planctomycetia bacterium]
MELRKWGECLIRPWMAVLGAEQVPSAVSRMLRELVILELGTELARATREAEVAAEAEAAEVAGVVESKSV